MAIEIERLLRLRAWTSEELASEIYKDDPDGGPEWALVCMRMTISRMRKRGIPVINKPHTEASTHSGYGKTGRGTKALYSLLPVKEDAHAC